MEKSGKSYSQNPNMNQCAYAFVLYNVIMGTKWYGADVKKRAKALRKTGKTYAEIRKEVSVSKSTLSVWLGEKFKGIFDRKAQLEHLQRARALAVARIQKDKAARDSISVAKGEDVALSLPVEDVAFQKALLAMLYWAE